MLQPGAYAAVRVKQGDFHRHRPLGEGQQEGVFKAFGGRVRLVRLQPFLKEGGERGAVDNRAVRQGFHHDLPVAGQGQFCQVVASSGPAGQGGELVQADGLFVGIAGEQVIHAQGPVSEIGIECLCLHPQAEEDAGEEQVSFFHNRMYFPGKSNIKKRDAGQVA